jgi:hypothetical protein
LFALTDGFWYLVVEGLTNAIPFVTGSGDVHYYRAVAWANQEDDG